MGPVIVRVLSGTATPADDADLRQWVAADPDRARELQRLRAIWAEAGALQRDWDTTGLQQRILRIPDVTPDAAVLPLRRGRRLPQFGHRPAWWDRRRRAWLPVGAAAALLIATGALIWQQRGERQRAVAVGQISLTEIATRRGQQAALRLSDGTRITLGVGSRMRYPESFAGGTSRDVYLEGEAYFEVARDAARPFRVHAGDAVTRVLGTRFGVRAYAEDRRVRVVVAEGRVAFGQGPAAEVVLGSGDLGEVGAGGVPAVQHGVDVAGYLAWVERRLVFSDTPVREVAQQLSRWYDLDVRLADSSLADVPYTTSLRGDEPPEHVLQVLADVVGARLEKRGTAYVIVRKVSSPS